MTVSGGTAPYTYSIVGSLPAGLSLNASTGAVTGTATSAGTFSVQVKDANGATSTACAITIVQPSENSSCAFGVASAYNMVALNGDINDGVDITGRIAAQGRVLQATTIGSGLRSGDPYIALAAENGGPYAIVAGGGIPTSNQFWVNAGGNVYSSTATSANFGFANENYSGSLYTGSKLVTGGISPIDFATLGSEMNSLSAKLAALSATGVICTVNNSGSIVPGGGCPSSSQHYNPSWLLLYGPNATTNVFNLTQAQFQGNQNLDLEVPTGSTAIINVAGTSDTLPYNILFQGSTVTDANAGNILFNFPNANAVTINAQFDGVFLAPNASLSSTNQMGGILIAASIATTGETHYDPFVGTLPVAGQCSSSSVALSVTCAATTTGEAGVAFNSGPIAVTGGTAPYTYSIVGTLPVGLTLNTSTGAITGTPTAGGTFSVKVTDANGAADTACPITISSALSVTWGSNSAGTVGAAFNSGALTVSGGTTPYTYSIVGTLPAGLALNTATGAVTGTPTCSGSFSVKVADADGVTSTSSDLNISPSASAGYTMTVNPSSLTVEAGKSATTTFTFTPTGGYVGTVAFSCSGLPAGVTCTFVPPSVTADGSNTVQTSTLTVTTTGSGTAKIAMNETTSGVTLAGVFFLPGLMLGGLVAWRRRSFTARMRGMLLLLVMGVMMTGGVIGCGGSIIQTVTPLGTHVVTVEAKTTVSANSSNGASPTQTASFTLTVTE
jgi:choice-of-anchor A domain-containing protein